MSSKAEYWQRGEVIDFTNATDETIAANEIVQIGSRIGVAGTVIAPGSTGTLHVFGVFDMPKDKAAIAIGANVYYKDGAITATESGSVVGYATEAADADASTVKVKLLG
jgi:predicted RecA/RadA family phage recombinase